MRSNFYKDYKFVISAGLKAFRNLENDYGLIVLMLLRVNATFATVRSF